MPTPPTKTKTIRRSISMAIDLASWFSWYATMSGRSIVEVFDEMQRQFYEAHRDEFDGGPQVKSAPLVGKEYDGRKAKK